MYDIKKLRKEAAARAVSNDIARLAAEHDRIITAAIRENNRRTGAAIDSGLTHAKISTERATTRQLEFDRQTIADHALTNPVLARIYRRAQAIAYK